MGGIEGRYIARRLVVIASEDVGLTDPQALQQRFVRYDKNGEEHYNVASALQKSIVEAKSGSEQ